MLYVDIECDFNYSREFLAGLTLETDHKKNLTSVKAIANHECPSNIRVAVKTGDILTSINGHIVLNEDIKDILALLDLLKLSALPLRLKFINPQKITVAAFLERLTLQTKSQKDIYGFTRTVEYLIAERQHLAVQRSTLLARDMEWTEYLKSIGGPDNLKPAGML